MTINTIKGSDRVWRERERERMKYILIVVAYGVDCFLIVYQKSNQNSHENLNEKRSKTKNKKLIVTENKREK